MATSNANAQAILRQEIIDQARRQGDDIISRARRQADAIMAKASAEADAARRERLDLAQHETTRRTEAIKATIPVESNRLRLARIEALLQSIYEKVRIRLQTRVGFDYREVVIALAAQALAGMEGESFVVKLSAEDCRILGDELADAIRRSANRTPLAIMMSEDPAITDGTVMIQDVEGRHAWNIGLLARLDRLWPEIRRQIAARASFVAPTGSPGGAV